MIIEETKEKNNKIEELLKENNIIQETNQKELSGDLKTLIYNTEKINDKLRESNKYLERISSRVGTIVFLLLLPLIIKILMLIFAVDTLKDLIEIFYNM